MRELKEGKLEEGDLDLTKGDLGGEDAHRSTTFSL
jgi:hypothetical protein